MTQPNDKPGIKRPRRFSLFWRVSAVLLIPLMILILGTGFVLLTFNANRYGPALVSALENITGRQVTLNGPVKIDWSLTPAIQADDIVIANPPGFSDRSLLTLRGLRADIALLPLFSNRVDILKLVLISPQLTLERRPDGTADWDLSTARARTASALPFLSSNLKVALEAVEVEDGRVTLRSSAGQAASTIHITKLIGTAPSLSAPMHLSAQAEIGSTPFAVEGVVGPIERFSGIGTGPWPVALEFTMAGARLTVDGTIKRPRDASGYRLAINLSATALDKWGTALPPALTKGLPLPPLQNITATAHIADAGSRLPAVTDLTLTVGKSDLSAWRPGLTLNDLTVTLPAWDEPFSVTANGTSDSGDFDVKGQFGALQSLFSPGWLPASDAGQHSFPIAITAQLGSANATIMGAIATPQTLSGTALALKANIPDLSALSAMAGMELPAWKNLSLQSSLIDPGGVGLYSAIGLDGLTVTMDNAAFGGAATLYLKPQEKLQLSLDFSQINLDALRAAYPAQSDAVPTAPATAPAPVEAPAESTTPIIPDATIPLNFLSWGNAEIQLSADDALLNGAHFTALQADATLAGRKLTLASLTGEIPGGSITASGSLDASADTAAESLAVRAPALALGPLVKAIGLPGSAEGNVQVQLSASSLGNTLPAIAANLNGQLGIAFVNAEIDGSLLARAFGPLEKAAGLPPPGGAPVAVRCFGLALGAAKGTVQLDTLGLDSSALLLQGTGSLNLGQESFNLAFQPLGAPQVTLGGSFAQPLWTAAAPQPEPAPPVASASQQRPDICPATLSLARLGQAGPAAPPPASMPAAAAAPAGNGPKNLNSLLNP